MVEELVHKIQWKDVVEYLQPDLFEHHLKIREQYKNGILKGNLESKFSLKRIWDGTGRKDWISRIKKSPNLEECLEKSRKNLNEKYNEKWLSKYHTLYYDVKKEGYKKKGSPITAIKFGDDHFYRMDGTHRSSVLFDLGIKRVQALVIDFREICKLNPVLREKFEEWVLENYRNYQKTGTTGESRIEERYVNLTKLTKEYFSDKIVGDVGCNAGFLSIMLSNEGASEVKGFDINEYDLEAARIFAERKCDNPEMISFYEGHVVKNLSQLLRCEVIFFVRSIYHIGKDVDILIKSLKSGTTVIIECNRGHKKKLPNPDEIKPIPGKRLALKINVVPFLEERGFTIEENLKNVDDVVIATKI